MITKINNNNTQLITSNPNEKCDPQYAIRNLQFAIRNLQFSTRKHAICECHGHRQDTNKFRG